MYTQVIKFYGKIFYEGLTYNDLWNVIDYYIYFWNNITVYTIVYNASLGIDCMENVLGIIRLWKNMFCTTVLGFLVTMLVVHSYS